MSDEEQPLALRWEDFVFRYAGEDGNALDGITLDVHAGEKVLIMGSSGCGKSTLGLTLNGIVPASTGGETSGSVRVGLLEPQSESLSTMAATVGLVFQDPDSQLCTINVRDEITFGPQNLLMPAESIHARTADVASLVGIADRLDDPVFNLSGGQKQRVAIASTLSVRPNVLVLDEPTANLDPAGRQDVLNVLRTLLESSDATTLIVEHHPTELLTVCDRVVVMDRGRVRFVGPPRTVFTRHGRGLIDLGVRLPAPVLFQLGMGQGREEVALSSEGIDFDAMLGPATHSPPDHPSPRGSGGEPVLEIKDVEFGYDRARKVLHGLDFTVGKGEVMALLGANGSGKSTTGSLLVGLHRPQRGRISVSGQDTARVPIHDLARHIGYVFQYPEHQFVTDRVLDEVSFSLRRLGRANGPDEELARRQLERFDLQHLADRHPFRLSLGQKRRLSIAAMSVYRPDVLVLDEPTFGQDQRHTDELADIIRELSADGVAVILITHDLRLTAELADRAVVLGDGQVVFDDAPQRLLAALHDGPRWGLWPLEEYTLWLEVATRAPEVAFTVDPLALAAEVTTRTVT